MSPVPVPAVAEFVHELPDDTFAAGAAREFVRQHADVLPTARLEDLLLLVSEIATNAVRHGCPEITLLVTLGASRLRIAVHDCGDRLPSAVVVEPAADSCNGRGLMIVAAVADSWGVECDPDVGKSVWFEFAR